MIHLPASVQVYRRLSACDIRKSFDSLHALVPDYLELDPYTGHLVVFASRRRDRVKILHWGVSRMQVQTCRAAPKMGVGRPEGRLSGAGFKPPGAPALKRRGGERPTKRSPRGCQVSVEKMSESKPADDASSIIQGTVRTGAAPLSELHSPALSSLTRSEEVDEITEWAHDVPPLCG